MNKFSVFHFIYRCRVNIKIKVMATTWHRISTFATVGYSAYLNAILIKSHKFIFQILWIFSPVKDES